MKRSERKIVIKTFLFCALFFALGAFIVYTNTRYNGFKDVQPLSYFTEIIKHYYERLGAVLNKFTGLLQIWY